MCSPEDMLAVMHVNGDVLVMPLSSDNDLDVRAVAYIKPRLRELGVGADEGRAEDTSGDE